MCFRGRNLSLSQPVSVLLRLAYRTGGWDCPLLLPSPRPSPSPPKPFLFLPLRHPFLHHSFRFLSDPLLALFVPDACCRHGTVVCAKWLSNRRLEKERLAFCSRRADEQFELYRLCNSLELSVLGGSAVKWLDRRSVSDLRSPGFHPLATYACDI